MKQGLKPNRKEPVPELEPLDIFRTRNLFLINSRITNIHVIFNYFSTDFISGNREQQQYYGLKYVTCIGTPCRNYSHTL